MRTKTLSFLAVALLGVATTGGYAVAQSTAPTGTDPTAAATDSGAGTMRQHRGRHAARAAMANDPVFAVKRNLIQLERLYILDGRAKDVPALYQDLLTRTQNAQLRSFAYARIAKQQARPANPTQVIATVKQALDENLSRVQ